MATRSNAARWWWVGALALAGACAEEHNQSALGSGDGKLDSDGDEQEVGDGRVPDAPRSDAGTPDDNRPRACHELDLPSCTPAHCAVRSGHLLDEAKRCIGELAPVACDQRISGGDGALGYGRDANGRVWQFSSMSLVPSTLERVYESADNAWGGWPLCKPQAQLPNQRCSELSTSMCEADPACVAIRGVPYDPGRKCRREAPVIVGCTQADMPCPPSIVHARYPGAAEAYEIASGCLPAKFERVDYPGDLQSFALCPAN